MSDNARNATDTEAPPGLNLVRVLVITGVVLAVGVSLTHRIPGVENHARDRDARMYDALAATHDRALAVLRGEGGAARAGDSVDIEDLASGQRRITVRSPVMGAVAATAVAQGRTVPAPSPQASSPADLPRLTEEASRSAASAPRWLIQGRQVLHGQDVTGLLVLAPGAELVLTDVVIRGSIVSADVLGEVAVGPASTAIVRIEGAVRIEPGPHLPGVAVLMPGGEIVASPRSSVQLHGDVIASSVDFAGYGSLLGRIASVAQPRLGPNVATRSRGSHVDHWSTALAHTHSVPSYVAFVPAASSWDDVAAMTGFRFP